MTALAPARLDEVRDLLAELITRRDTPPDDPAEQRELLARCRQALTDVLNDRDDLDRAHSETAEELARWTGAL